MAVLSDADRFDLWAEWMRELPRSETVGVVTKQDVRAAINAIDEFLHANAAAINNALPQPARGQLTAAQKALLLVYVIKQRYLSGV